VIEEFMIAANVAAAEALEARRAPCMYRIHPPPDGAKLEALRGFLESFGLSLPRGQMTRAAQFAEILARAGDTGSADVIHESILRAQSQAAYSPGNLGHFGLALRRYAHFTSPIRRYADLMVHRSLIGAWQLGPGGTGRDAGEMFEETGDHISATERKAQAAEREALDRYLALYLSERMGARMAGRITGVTRFGLFVRLKGLGADGLVPMGLLGRERFRHDEAHHCLEGQSSGTVYGMGDDVEVEIREADPVTGGLVLAITRHRPLERTGRGRDRGGRGRPHQAPRRGPGRHGGARRRG
jgi:ribonuclease R